MHGKPLRKPLQVDVGSVLICQKRILQIYLRYQLVKQAEKSGIFTAGIPGLLWIE
jgi:hypothetical protein